MIVLNIEKRKQPDKKGLKIYNITNKIRENMAKKQTNKLKFNKNGTIDIPAGEYNLSDVKDKFSIKKLVRRIFHFHKYHSMGIMEFNVGEVVVYGKKYKLNGQKLELFVCAICNKIKCKVIN